MELLLQFIFRDVAAFPKMLSDVPAFCEPPPSHKKRAGTAFGGPGSRFQVCGLGAGPENEGTAVADNNEDEEKLCVERYVRDSHYDPLLLSKNLKYGAFRVLRRMIPPFPPRVKRKFTSAFAVSFVPGGYQRLRRIVLLERRAEEKTLAVVDSDLFHEAVDLLVLDEFRDALLSGPSAKIDDARDQEPCFGVVFHPEDQGTVDLDDIRSDVQEVDEVRIAGTEIVDGDLASERAGLLEKNRAQVDFHKIFRLENF